MVVDLSAEAEHRRCRRYRLLHPTVAVNQCLPIVSCIVWVGMLWLVVSACVRRPGFLKHFLRSEYGTLKLSPSNTPESQQAYMNRLFAFWTHTREWLAPGVTHPAVVDVFAALSAACLLSSPQRLAAATPSTPAGKKAPLGARVASTFLLQWAHAGCALLLAWAMYVVVFHYLANLPVDAPMPLGVLARFWMQPDILTAIAAGRGLAALLQTALAVIGGRAAAAAAASTCFPRCISGCCGQPPL